MPVLVGLDVEASEHSPAPLQSDTVVVTVTEPAVSTGTTPPLDSVVYATISAKSLVWFQWMSRRCCRWLTTSRIRRDERKEREGADSDD